MANIALSIKFSWELVDADMSKCIACKETIFYKMHQGYLEVANEKMQTELKLCDACFNAIDFSDE